MYKVCLVDDEKLELNLLKNHVNWERLGVKEVFTAGNGQKALELVRAHNPDIVFTDIRMPVMDGIEFAKRLRELERVGGMHRSPVKVIFLTGYDDMELIRKAFRLAASDYILKPFLVEDIEKAAGEIINSLNQENISSQPGGKDAPFRVGDAMFYEEEDRRLPSGGLSFEQRKKEFSEEEYRNLRLLRRDIVSCLSRGDRDGTGERLKAYYEACSRGTAGIFRDGAVCLCYQINEELVAENEDLSRCRQDLALRGKTILRLMEEAGNAAGIKRCMDEYVNGLLEWFCSLKEDGNYRVVAFVGDYIGKHYMEPVSVEEMAEKIGLSPGYVRSIFKSGKGMTVNSYLSEYRLEKACGLLKNTSKGVGRIGRLVGYDNVSYFCSIFQKRYGKTPSEWRRGL